MGVRYQGDQVSVDIFRQRYNEQPHEVAIETLAMCNARCTFCPYPTLERIGTKMPDELIERLIDEMATFQQPFFFSPFKVNEPLLDKRLIPICERFNEKAPGGLLRLFTNGAALTDDNISDVASLDNVIHLWVSLNSHKPDEYEALMGMPFDRTAKRLDRLHSRPFPHPVVLSCVGYPNEDFRRYCHERWPDFQSVAIQKSAWLGYTDSQAEEVPDTACSRWWELSVMSTGVVSLCCMDGEGKCAIGDVNKQTLLEVYNAPQWKAHRMLATRRGGMAPCSTCTY